MPSIFYPSEGSSLPFLFYEAITVIQEGDQDIELGEVIQKAYRVCHPHHSKLKPAQVEAIAKRLISEAEDAKKKAEELAGPFKREKPPEAKRKAHGGFLIDWISSLEAWQLCLFVADFDLSEARRLYCKEDKWTVMQASELKGAYTWEQARAAHEAVLFGMGGGYKGYTQEEGVKEINLSEMEGPVPTAELRKFGLMQPN